MAPAVKKPSAPKNPRSHPPYVEMINDAILALKERSGSSQYAIAKYVEDKQKNNLPPNFKKLLSVQLKKLAAAGKLVKVKNSFKVSAAGKPSAAAPKKVPAAAAAKAPAKKKVAVKAKAAGAAPVKAKKKVAAKPKAAKVTTPAKKAVAKIVAKAKAKKKTPVKVAAKKPKTIKSPVKKAVAKKAAAKK